MTIEIGTLIALATTIIAAAVGYGRLQGRIERNGEQIKALDDWRSSTNETRKSNGEPTTAG